MESVVSEGDVGLSSVADVPERGGVVEEGAVVGDGLGDEFSEPGVADSHDVEEVPAAERSEGGGDVGGLVVVFGVGEEDDEGASFPAGGKVGEGGGVVGLDGVGLGVVEGGEDGGDLGFTFFGGDVAFDAVVEDEESDLVSGSFGGVDEEEGGV